MKKLTRLLALLACSAGSVPAQNFAIDWHVLAPGGGPAAGGGYELNGTVAQPATGVSGGNGYVLEGGFWPGATAPSGPCLLTITQSPADVAAYAGQTVMLQVGATGMPAPVSYQWQEDRGDNFGFRDVPGAISPTYLRTLTPLDTFLFARCLVGNGCTNVFSGGAGLGVITPMVSIAGVTVPEGNAGPTPAVFTVALSVISAAPVTVTAFTSDGTALGGVDYVPVTNTVTIPPGNLAATFSLPVLGDTAVEKSEMFFVSLRDPVNAVLVAGNVGVGTILDDDFSNVRLEAFPPAVSSGRLTLVWPDLAVAHKLQRATDLSLRHWIDQRMSPEYAGGLARVEVPTIGTAGFFRLSDADGSEDCVITITPDPVTVKAGRTVTVSASAVPVLGGSFTWSIAAANVAQTSPAPGAVRGNKITVEGLSAGTTTLTVTYALPLPPGGTCTATVTLTVE